MPSVLIAAPFSLLSVLFLYGFLPRFLAGLSFGVCMFVDSPEPLYVAGLAQDFSSIYVLFSWRTYNVLTVCFQSDQLTHKGILPHLWALKTIVCLPFFQS